MNQSVARFYYQDEVFSLQTLCSRLHDKLEQLADWELDLLQFLQDWQSDEDRIQVQTSGSTGQPKIISLRKTHMLLSARASVDYFSILESSTLALCLPVKFIAGKMMIIRTLVAKCKLIIQPPSSDPFSQFRQAINFIAVTPHQLNQSLKTGSVSPDFQKILIGGESIPTDLRQQIQSLPNQCYASFGMTETITHIAVQSLNHPAEQHYNCLPGILISLNAENCLQIDGPWLENPIETHDIVQIISPEQFTWMGRSDFVINSGGIKLHPEKIEGKIQHDLPFSFLVSSIPDPNFGEIPVLIIESKSKDIPISLDEINSNLDRFEKLKGLFIVRSISKTENGKTDRKAMKDFIQSNP